MPFLTDTNHDRDEEEIHYSRKLLSRLVTALLSESSSSAVTASVCPLNLNANGRRARTSHSRT